jgi:hypothetical protein
MWYCYHNKPGNKKKKLWLESKYHKIHKFKKLSNVTVILYNPVGAHSKKEVLKVP